MVVVHVCRNCRKPANVITQDGMCINCSKKIRRKHQMGKFNQKMTGLNTIMSGGIV